MRLKLIAALAFFLLAIPARASLTAVYIGQAAAGTADGSSCANQYAITFFNTAGNWGAGAAQIGQDTTVHLCGTITSVMTVQGSGAAGNLITIQWETGASLQACSTTGSFRIDGRSYLVLDLGANSTAIECPNNGDGLGTAIAALGIYDGGTVASHVEVRNGTIGPMYVHVQGNTSTSGNSAYGISLAGGGNLSFHNLTVTGGGKGILWAGSTAGTSGNTIYQSTFVNDGAGIYYACGSTSCTDSGATIHDNDFTVGLNWSGSGIHQEDIHIFSNGAGSSITGLLYYNNYEHGNWPASGGTSNIEIDQGVFGDGNGSTSGYIFNNVCVEGNDGNKAGNGCVYAQRNDQNWGVYNNTIDCVSNANPPAAFGIELDNITGTTYVAKNNIVMNCDVPYNTSGSTVTGLTMDYMDWYNVGSLGWATNTSGSATFYATLAAWKAFSGTDANSITTIPGLNTDYTITNSSSNAHLAGTNLTGLGIAALDIGAPQTFGVSGACGTGCVARSSSASWDLGAYPLASASAASAPTFSPVGGTYSSTQSVTLSSSSSGAVICYTTNGTTPVTNGTSGCTTGTLYSVAISVSTSETVKAVAGGTGYADSSVASAAYTIGASSSAPTFSVTAGTYTSQVTLTISTTAGTVICYTINGTTPATNGASGCTTGTLYSGPITLNTFMSFKAIAGGTGYTDSTVASSGSYKFAIPTAPSRIGLLMAKAK